MSCEEFIANRSLNASNSTAVPQDKITHYVELVFIHIGLPVVFIFGIVGNILNLAVLTRKQLQKSMDYMEKSAHIGLTALAVSDLMFCLVALPYPFIERKHFYTSDDFLLPLYYSMIHTPLFNLFILSSTWLTVFMALTRYLAICYPLRARLLISLNGTKIGILVVFLASVALNFPRFWNYQLVQRQCAELCTCYHRGPMDLFVEGNFEFIYRILWAILGVFIPLVALIFFNICLIQALRNSNRMQMQCRANKPKQTTHQVTLTLVSIIVLFILLVCPSEVISSLGLISHNQSYLKWRSYRIIGIISNFMMACNFAVNFVLYCIINKHFRNTIKSLLCFKCFRKNSSQQQSVTQTNDMTILTEMDPTMDVTAL